MAQKQFDSEAIERVVEKLNAFAEGLEPEERTVIEVMLRQVLEEGEEAEVSGFNFATFDLGMPSFDASSLSAGLKGRFCDEGGSWTLILDGGDDQLRQF